MLTPDASQIPSNWYDIEEARTATRSGLPVNDLLLAQILEIAAQQVVEYGPLILTESDPVPPNYRQAQLLQTKNIWSAQVVDPGSGQVDDGSGFQIRPYPLDWMVRQIIRPLQAVPGIY